MLRPADTVICGVIGAIAGAGALVVCVMFEAAPTVVGVLPVGLGVGVRQLVLGMLKRRAWQRANAERC